MIASNRPALSQALAALKGFAFRTKKEIDEQERASSRLPNAPQGDTNAQLAKITVTEYQHITSEITRIYAANAETTYSPFGNNKGA